MLAPYRLYNDTSRSHIAFSTIPYPLGDYPDTPTPSLDPPSGTSHLPISSYTE